MLFVQYGIVPLIGTKVQFPQIYRTDVAAVALASVVITVNKAWRTEAMPAGALKVDKTDAMCLGRSSRR